MDFGLLTQTSARWRPTIFLRSYDVLSVASSRSTHSSSPAATRRYVKLVCLPTFESSPRLLTKQTGHSSLTASCPVCEHSPLSPDDCRPSKSLRTTIRAFIGTEEKKRERQRQPKDSAPPTPIEAKPPSLVADATAEPTPGQDESQPQEYPAPTALAFAGEATQQDSQQGLNVSCSLTVSSQKPSNKSLAGCIRRFCREPRRRSRS